MDKIIEVTGSSVVAQEVLQKAGWKKIDLVDENYPNRQFYKKGDNFCKISFPVWKGNAVRLEKLN